MSIEYSVQIVWSKEDEAYLAAPAELPGCIADGKTQEEAIQNLRQVIAEWIEVAKKDGRAVPQPMTTEDFEIAQAQFQKQLQANIRQQVQSAMEQALKEILSVQAQPHTVFVRGGYFQEPELELAGESHNR